MADAKQKVISAVFPPELYGQRDELKKRAKGAGMTASKYALIILTRHINNEKPLVVR